MHTFLHFTQRAERKQKSIRRTSIPLIFRLYPPCISFARFALFLHTCTHIIRNNRAVSVCILATLCFLFSVRPRVSRAGVGFRFLLVKKRMFRRGTIGFPPDLLDPTPGGVFLDAVQRFKSSFLSRSCLFFFSPLPSPLYRRTFVFAVFFRSVVYG